jgi:hypothetical protein
LIELYRGYFDSPSKVFFVSSDKILRYWDMTRENKEYPVVIYPSQLFLLLIKIFGRSDNDFDSFISFINIRTNSKHLSAEKANIVISAISSITEDIIAQQEIVTSVFDDDFQNVIKHSNSDDELYKEVQNISQKYLENELSTQKEALNSAVSDIYKLTDKVNKLQESAEEKTEENVKSRQEIKDKANELEAYKKKTNEYAERKTRFRYVLYWYVSPIVVCLYCLFVIVFILFQFIFETQTWNFSISFVKYIMSTTFGQTTGQNALIYINTIAGTIMISLFRIFRKPIFRREGKVESKIKMINDYIIKYKLL